MLNPLLRSVVLAGLNRTSVAMGWLLSQTCKRWLAASLASLMLLFAFAPAAWAFCGFFVAKADAKLVNTASRVAIAHSGDRSVFLMSNNYQGDVRDFARIVPIPVIPTREQVRIGDSKIVEKLDAFTAPRLAQYLDRPCRTERALYPVMGVGLAYLVLIAIALVWRRRRRFITLIIAFISGALFAFVFVLPSFLNQANRATSNLLSQGIGFNGPAVNVTVEDRFTVGEYDIAILSADESNSLTAWLRQNEYQIADGAEKMLQSYIDDGMKFFVVKVNLAAYEDSNLEFLRPIVLDYESSDFMLPIRLGTLNAAGDQDLILHILSPKALVEVRNYQTVTVPTDAQSRQNRPSGKELPPFIEQEFGPFYQDLFQRQYEQKDKKVAFLEYASEPNAARGVATGQTFGLGNKCDPCTVPPEKIPTPVDFKQAGAWWESDDPLAPPKTYVTRLHIRYTQEKFPEDLRFQEVAPNVLKEQLMDSGDYFENAAGTIFQARYVVRRPLGNTVCVSGLGYGHLARQTAKNLTRLTGWKQSEVRQKMKADRVNRLDAWGSSALIRAIQANDLARTQQLIAQRANPNARELRSGMTALMWAASHQQSDIAQLLLENGAAVNVRDNRGFTPLHWAVLAEQFEVAKQMLERGADIDATDNQGKSVADYAKEDKKVQQLLESYQFQNE